MDSDDPRHLAQVLNDLSEPINVVLASGDPLWFGIGRILTDRLGAERLRFHPAPTCRNWPLPASVVPGRTPVG